MKALLIYSLLFLMAVLVSVHGDSSENLTRDGAEILSPQRNSSKSGLLKRSSRYLNRRQSLKKVKTLRRIKRYYDLQSYRSPQSVYHDQSNREKNRAIPEPQPYGHLIEVEPGKTLVNLRVVPEENSQILYVEPVSVGHKIMIRPAQPEQSGLRSENYWRDKNLRNVHQSIDTETSRNFPYYPHMPNLATRNENEPNEISANNLLQSGSLTKNPSIHSEYDYHYPGLIDGYLKRADDENEIHVASSPKFMPNPYPLPSVDSHYGYQVDNKHSGFAGGEYWKSADNENYATRSPELATPNVNPYSHVDSQYGYQVDNKHSGFAGGEYWKPADNENYATRSPELATPNVNPYSHVDSQYGYWVDNKHSGFTGGGYWHPVNNENPHITSSPQYIPNIFSQPPVDSGYGYQVDYHHPGYPDDNYLEPAGNAKEIHSTSSLEFAIPNITPTVDSKYHYEVDYQHPKPIDDIYLKPTVEKKNHYNVTETKIIETVLPSTQTTDVVSDAGHDLSLSSSSASQSSTHDKNITTQVPIIDLNDGEDFIAKPTPERIESLFEGSGEFDSRGIDINVESSTGRFIDLFSSNETCTTPKGEPGHCRSLRQCVLQDVVSNFNMYLQYMCMTRTTLLGICCPDNPVIGVTNPDLDAVTSEAAGVFSQPPDGCGVNSRTRIVGGFSAKPHEWIWMVALLRKNRFFCGGVLINSQYVLTAAHCVMSSNIRDIVARLGEHDLNDELRHQQDIPLAEVKRHAKFTTLTFQNDIALLKLRHPVEFTRFVGTICLPKAGSNYTNINATVAGWGTVSFGGAPSNVLQQVTVPVWDNEECDRTYALETINESFMCAGSSVKSQDACQGDSGGPLMVLNDNGRWEVIGLVSWGRRCGDPNFPGVYTRVTTYLDWIHENAQ